MTARAGSRSSSSHRPAAQAPARSARRLATGALGVVAFAGVCAAWVDVDWRGAERDLVLHFRNGAEVRAWLSGASNREGVQADPPASRADAASEEPREDIHWKDRRELDRLVERTTSD